MRRFIAGLIALGAALAPSYAQPGPTPGGQDRAAIKSVVSVTRAGSASPGNCNTDYALGGAALYTFTIPAASSFAVGCTLTLSNVDPFPTYTSSTFNGIISGTT